MSEKQENEKKLYSASKEGKAEDVRTLIYKHMVDVNFNFGPPGLSRLTPLIVATLNGHNEVVQILLNAGADIQRTDDERGTPLHWAAKYNRYEIVKILLGAGAGRLVNM